MRMFHRLPAAVSSAKLSKSGGVVERSIAPVLKTGDPQGSVGSNPTPSDFRRSRVETFRWDENEVRAGDRAPEAANPTPSDFRRSRVETFRWDENAAPRHKPTKGRPGRATGRGAGINFRSSSRRSRVRNFFVFLVAWCEGDHPKSSVCQPTRYEPTRLRAP